MERLTFSSFNLKATLDSGQLFRYRREGEGWIVQHGDFALYCEQRQNVLRYEGVHADGKRMTVEEVRSFFRIDDSHDRLLGRLSQDKYIADLSQKYRGIHLIRQDLAECVVAFLCSSAANIPKIRINLQLICERYGKEFTLRGHRCHAFPDPRKLSDEQALREARTGFRARYIALASKRLTPRFLSKLRCASYLDAREMLLALPGIGEKIADCILLFALGHTRSFPVDTWMRKTMLEHYGDDVRTQMRVEIKANARMAGGKRASHPSARIPKRAGAAAVSERHISRFGERYFGQSAGLAQQYLYVEARAKPRASPPARARGRDGR